MAAVPVPDFLRIFFYDNDNEDSEPDVRDASNVKPTTTTSQDAAQWDHVTVIQLDSTTVSDRGQPAVETKPEVENVTEKKPFHKEWNDTIRNCQKFVLVLVYYIIGVAFYNHYEGWDVLTCVYYITVTSTTIGYGDFYPTSDNARIFTIIYFFGGVIIVVSVLNSVIEEAFVNLEILIKHWQSKREKENGQIEDRTERAQREINNLLRRCVMLVTALLLQILLGGAYFHWAEGWTYTTAVYFSFITVMTIGYGEIHPSHPKSRVFCIFYMIVSMSLVSTVISSVSSVRNQIRAEKLRLELLNAKLDENLIDNMDIDDDDMITKFEYVIVMLVKTGVIDPSKHVTPWVEKFDEMDVSGDGSLSTQDIKAAMALSNKSAFENPLKSVKRNMNRRMTQKLDVMKASYEEEF